MQQAAHAALLGRRSRGFPPELSRRLQSRLGEGACNLCAGGLCPVAVPGIENINLTSIIAGHFDYIRKMDEIMELVSLYG